MKIRFNNWLCDIIIGAYGNGRKAIQLFDSETHEPIATATVNVSTHEWPFQANEVIIKNYSENEGIYECLRDAGVISTTYAHVPLGFTSGLACELLIEE